MGLKNVLKTLCGIYYRPKSSQRNNSSLDAFLTRIGIKAANISAENGDFPAAWPWPKTVSISWGYTTFTTPFAWQKDEKRKIHGKENKSI